MVWRVLLLVVAIWCVAAAIAANVFGRMVIHDDPVGGDDEDDADAV